jgi:hypothetical protein
MLFLVTRHLELKFLNRPTWEQAGFFIQNTAGVSYASVLAAIPRMIFKIQPIEMGRLTLNQRLHSATMRNFLLH